MKLPRLALFDSGARKSLVRAFAKLSERAPASVPEEFANPDRQDLDRIVFDALGLTAAERAEIYDSVVALVAARHDIAKLRKLRRESRVDRDVSIVIDDILKEVIPDGMKPFPEAFVRADTKSSQHPVPARGLKVINAPRIVGHGHLFGNDGFELVADDAYSHMVDSPAIANYLNFAQNGHARTVSVPLDAIELQRALNDYERYLRSIETALTEAIFKRVLASRRVDTVVDQVFNELQLVRTPLTFRGQLIR